MRDARVGDGERHGRRDTFLPTDSTGVGWTPKFGEAKVLKRSGLYFRNRGHVLSVVTVDLLDDN